MRAGHCYREDDGGGSGGGGGGRLSKSITATSTPTRLAGKLPRNGPGNNNNALACSGCNRPPQGGRRRRRPRRPATPPHPLSCLVVALHLALVLVIAAGGCYDGGTSEWQHPHRRSEPSHPSSSGGSGGAGGAWAARGSESRRYVTRAGRGGWRGDEYRGGYSAAGAAAAGRSQSLGRGSRGARGDGGTRGEARGWSERKKVGSESMREIIEVGF